MLRRWQWNFCKLPSSLRGFEVTDSLLQDRLENEHLGNMDQYRITREVPLPYSFDTVHDDGDDGDEGDEGDE